MPVSHGNEACLAFDTVVGDSSSSSEQQQQQAASFFHGEDNQHAVRSDGDQIPVQQQLISPCNCAEKVEASLNSFFDSIRQEMAKMQAWNDQRAVEVNKLNESVAGLYAKLIEDLNPEPDYEYPHIDSLAKLDEFDQRLSDETYCKQFIRGMSNWFKGCSGREVVAKSMSEVFDADFLLQCTWTGKAEDENKMRVASKIKFSAYGNIIGALSAAGRRFNKDLTHDAAAMVIHGRLKHKEQIARSKKQRKIFVRRPKSKMPAVTVASLPSPQNATESPVAAENSL